MKKLNLNERQINTLLYIKEHGNISNVRYQELADISKRTATRDLQELIERGLIEKVGTTGKGTTYTFRCRGT